MRAMRTGAMVAVLLAAGAVESDAQLPNHQIERAVRLADSRMSSASIRSGNALRAMRIAEARRLGQIARMQGAQVRANGSVVRGQAAAVRSQAVVVRGQAAVVRAGSAAIRFGLGAARVDAARSLAPIAAPRLPEPWLQEDPGARLYQEAREALNEGRFRAAAAAFDRLRATHPRSGYVADSYYWQAFALYRVGRRADLESAAALLRQQAEAHPRANTRSDADELGVRIQAQLARRGDARAAADIAERASGPCDEGQEVRLAALSALLNMNAERAVPILQEVLRSRDECSVELRRRAVFLVAQKMDDQTVDVLLDLAHRNPDPDREVREQAVFWLHQVEGPEALDALEAILTESPEAELQERAIFAISQRSDARSVEILKDYAERDDVPRELRERAIFWIGQNPRAGGAQYLMDLYGRLDDQELKERAIFGVAQSGGEAAAAWLFARVMDVDESVELRKNALFWAGQSDGIDVDRLTELYSTLADNEMKEQVIFVASQRDETGAVDFLMEVARDEEDRELRERAIFWLGQSNDPRVPEFLLTLIRG